MTVQINGTTGIDQIQDNTVSSAKIQAGTIQQSDLAAGLAGTGPCFRVYQNAAQSIPDGVTTQLSLQVKVFDTTNAFDASANFRFQPTVPGYYILTGTAGLSSTTGYLNPFIYKNGAVDTSGAITFGAAAANPVSSVTSLIYLNGSTAYADFRLLHGAGSAANTIAQPNYTVFQGFLARAA